MKGTVWRHVPAGAEPLHLGWMQQARGRWNTQRPRLTCLYTALTQDAALAEFRKHFLRSGLKPHQVNPRDLVSVRVDVDPVLNLTQAAVRITYGIHDEGELTGDSARHLARCRALARQAVRAGFRAIRAPSAALRGAHVLLLYPESVAGRCRVHNGSDRLAINHGRSPLLTP